MIDSPDPSIPMTEHETNSKREYVEWLESNKSLRMDANNSVFRESRRHFHLSRYEFARNFTADKVVLDAACGTGYGSALLSEVAAQVSGVDLSPEAISWAKETYGNERTTFHTACVEFTPFKADRFDLVVSFETLEHTLSPRTALWEFARVMKPDGTGIFSVPNGWGLTENHFVDFDLALLKSVLSECFDHAEFYYNNSGGRKSRTTGIGPLETLDGGKAECIIAKCAGPKKSRIPADMQGFWTSEIYESVFRRHREYIALRKSIPKLFRRFLIKN